MFYCDDCAEEKGWGGSLAQCAAGRPYALALPADPD
jgi:hypothetical protein